MSAGDITLRGEFLHLESADGRLVPIALVAPGMESIIDSLTVIHAVCKDTDIDVMREMQKKGVTFKSAWKKAVATTVADVLQEVLGVSVEAIPAEDLLKEMTKNVQKH